MGGTCSTSGASGTCCLCIGGPVRGSCNGCGKSIGSSGSCGQNAYCPEANGNCVANCPMNDNCMYLWGVFEKNCASGQVPANYDRRKLSNPSGMYRVHCGTSSPVFVDVTTDAGKLKLHECLSSTMDMLQWPSPLLGPLKLAFHEDFALDETKLLYGSDDTKPTYPVHHGEFHYPTIKSLQGFVDSHIDCILGSPTVTCIYYNSTSHSSMLTRPDLSPPSFNVDFLIPAVFVIPAFLALLLYVFRKTFKCEIVVVP